jgi:hypothetical protein
MKNNIKHNPPPVDGMCLVYYDPIDSTNYCEYQTNSGSWYPSPYCEHVIKMLLSTQFNQYKELVEKSTCKSQMRNLIKSGPPIYLYDKNLGIPDNEFIIQVWFSSSNEYCSGKLEGAVEGEERKELWERYRMFFELLPEEDE